MLLIKKDNMPVSPENEFVVDLLTKFSVYGVIPLANLLARFCQILLRADPLMTNVQIQNYK